MKLREWDWNAQDWVEVEYPDRIIAEFVEFFRNTQMWKEDDTAQVVFDRYQKLHNDLTDYRNDVARAAVPITELAPDPVTAGSGAGDVQTLATSVGNASFSAAERRLR